MAKAPLSQTLFLTEDGSTIAVTIANAVTIPPLVAPALKPVFTEDPSIAGTPQVGQTLTGMDGTITGGTVVSRRWLLGAAVVSTAQTYAATAAGSLLYEVTATGPGGTTVATSAAVTVVEANTGAPALNALTVSNAFHKGEALPNGTLLQNTTAGSAISAYPGVTQSGSGTSRALSGTPTVLSALVSETSGSTVRNNLLFALSSDTSRTMTVGMNPSLLDWFHRNDYFLDYLKASGEIVPAQNKNANGLPTALNGDGSKVAYFLPLESGQGVPVKFRIITNGDFDFSLTYNDGTSSTPVTKEGADWVFTYSGPETYNNNPIRLTMENTRTFPATLAVVRDDEAARYRAGNMYKQSLIARYAGYSQARFMDWAAMNRLTWLNISDNYVTFQTDGGGFVPYSAQARFAIEVGIDAWFCIRTNATDAQITALTSVFDTVKAAGLNVYVELGNELWNTGFTQNAYARQRAQAEGYGGGEYDGAYWWAGRRSKQIANLLAGKGYRTFLAGAFPDQPNTIDIVLQGADTVAFASGASFYAGISSGYTFGSLTINPPEPGMQEKQDGWLLNKDYDAMMDNINNYTGTAASSLVSRAPGWQAEKAKYAARGLKYYSYESHWAHLNKLPYGDRPGAGAAMEGVVVAPKARQMTLANLEVAQAVGFDSVTWFTDNYESRSGSQNGDFGSYRRPTWDGLKEFIARAITNDGVAAGFRYFVVAPATNTFGVTPAQPGGGYRFGSAEVTLFDGATPISKAGWSASQLDGAAATGNVVSRTVDGSTVNSYITDGGDGKAGTFAIDTGAASRVKPTTLTLHRCTEAPELSAGSGKVYGSNDLSTLTELGSFAGKTAGDYSGGALTIPLSYS